MTHTTIIYEQGKQKAIKLTRYQLQVLSSDKPVSTCQGLAITDKSKTLAEYGSTSGTLIGSNTEVPQVGALEAPEAESKKI